MSVRIGSETEANSRNRDNEPEGNDDRMGKGVGESDTSGDCVAITADFGDLRGFEIVRI
ncbi:hypothetical protein D3C76_1690290 [compost metagenome]